MVPEIVLLPGSTLKETNAIAEPLKKEHLYVKEETKSSYDSAHNNNDVTE